MVDVDLDVLIIGGGVAGLWCLARMLQQGRKAILLERSALGSGQTLLSQGIIHGGAKYTLQGALSGASQAIADMPGRWRSCLEGHGEIDLHQTRVLSSAHYFWTHGRLSDRLTGFFASKAMRGRTVRVPASQRPPVFQSPAFKGSLYRLDELVVDIPSLLDNLAQRCKGHLFQVDTLTDLTFKKGDDHEPVTLELKRNEIRFKAGQVLITAGEGYDALAARWGIKATRMQRRPLHMAMVAHDQAPDLYGHCVGTSSKPLLTVTTHPATIHSNDSGRKTWYLGGELAESSVDKSDSQLIEKAQATLEEVLPWVRLDNPAWRTVRVDRAEPQQPGLSRPDTAYVARSGPVLVAWPTKLALTPDLSDRVLEQLLPFGGEHSDSDTDALSQLQARLPSPPIAKTAWDDL